MVLAEDVSRTRRFAQIGSSVFFQLVCAGVVFGFAALKPILLKEGVYAEACDTPRCKEQDAKLNLMFTLATVVTNVSALPIGYTLDKIGPRKTSLLGAAVFGLGNFLFGLGIRRPGFDSYLIGYLLLAIGGPLIFLPSFQLSSAFPSHSGLILSALTGSFDASSLPYVLYRSAYNRSVNGIALRTFFWSYIGISVLVVLQQLLLGTDTPYGTANKVASEADERSALLPAAQEEEELNSSSFSRVHYGDFHGSAAERAKEELGKKDKLAGALFGFSASEQIKSSWFLVITAFLCVHMCRINFYIEQANEQLFYYTGDEQLADDLTTAFTYLLPIGGLAAIPFVGYLLDKRPTLDAFVVLGCLGAAFGVLGMTHSASTQIAATVCFVILRPLMYTSVSNYSTLVFGFETFGTVYGLANTISGLFGLVQYPLDLAVKYPLKGNPTIVNVALLAAGVLTTAGVAGRIWRATRVQL